LALLFGPLGYAADARADQAAVKRYQKALKLNERINAATIVSIAEYEWPKGEAGILRTRVEKTMPAISKTAGWWNR